MNRTLHDCADKIKSMVTMRDVAEMYGFSTDRRTQKIRCPFHDDNGPSLQVYPGSRGYYCFSCGTGGDVINFVQRLFSINFLDACRKMNDDFQLHLNIEGNMDAETRRAAELAHRARMEKKRRDEERRKLAYTIYDAAYNRFSFLDILMTSNRPTDPNKPISPDYIYAAKNIDAAWNEVQEAADALRKIEKESRV